MAAILCQWVLQVEACVKARLPVVANSEEGKQSQQTAEFIPQIQVNPIVVSPQSISSDPLRMEATQKNEDHLTLAAEQQQPMMTPKSPYVEMPDL